MIQCTACPLTFHLECCEPPLRRYPDHWMCHPCIAKKRVRSCARAENRPATSGGCVRFRRVLVLPEIRSSQLFVHARMQEKERARSDG